MSEVTLEPSWGFKDYRGDDDHIRLMTIGIRSDFGEVFLPVSLVPELVTALRNLVARMEDAGVRATAEAAWDQACELEHAARDQREMVRSPRIVLSVEGSG